MLWLRCLFTCFSMLLLLLLFKFQLRCATRAHHVKHHLQPDARMHTDTRVRFSRMLKKNMKNQRFEWKSDNQKSMLYVCVLLICVFGQCTAAAKKHHYYAWAADAQQWLGNRIMYVSFVVLRHATWDKSSDSMAIRSISSSRFLYI